MNTTAAGFEPAAIRSTIIPPKSQHGQEKKESSIYKRICAKKASVDQTPVLRSDKGAADWGPLNFYRRYRHEGWAGDQRTEVPKIPDRIQNKNNTISVITYRGGKTCGVGGDCPNGTTRNQDGISPSAS